jgi:osmoprotectant transport system permease protein
MKGLRLVASAAGLLVVVASAARSQDVGTGAPRTDIATTNGRPMIVASKPFGESYILAEMFAQLLEARGVRVERRIGLGATAIAYEALRTGAIDVYPEYTGTGLIVILGLPPDHDPAAVFSRVGRVSESRDSIRWLPPLGFENTYAIAVRRHTADSLHLSTLSDLAGVALRLRAGLTADFIGRPDGLPGLGSSYGIKFKSVQALLPAVKYQALAKGAVDIIDGFSTDGLIQRYDLVALRDDRHFYPPYDAAAVVGRRAQREEPRAVAALTELSGRIDVERMRALNRRLEVDGVPLAVIAHDALDSLGLLTTSTAGQPSTRTGDRLSLLSYVMGERQALLNDTVRHILLVAISLLAAIALAMPLALLLIRVPGPAEGVISGVGVIETIPGIALIAFMIPLFGIGIVPALVALFLYSLYPILRNAYTGLRDTNPAVVDAAKSLGMTSGQVLKYVRLPLAIPVIMAGVRTAAVIDVGTATLAAFIGAGGLGDPIVTGLALADTRMILSGAIPAALLALLVDGTLGAAEKWAVKRWPAGAARPGEEQRERCAPGRVAARALRARESSRPESRK